MTFSSPSWRSLNLWGGSLTIPCINLHIFFLGGEEEDFFGEVFRGNWDLVGNFVGLF